MDTSKYDTELRALEQQITNCLKEMEGICNAFIEVAKGFTVSWINKETENLVKTNHEITKELGIEGLQKLRNELEELCNKIPSLIEEDLSKDNYWPHKCTLPQGNYISFGLNGYEVDSLNQNVPILSDSIRRMLCLGGELLNQYGLIDFDSACWERGVGSRVYYKCNYGASEELFDVLKKYSDQLERALSLNNKLRQTERDKGQAEAQSLWEQAQ